jgi:hypothetical protein
MTHARILLIALLPLLGGWAGCPPTTDPAPSAPPKAPKNPKCYDIDHMHDPECG